MPINLETINAFYGRQMSPSQAKAFIEQEANQESIDRPRNLEEKAISQIGRPLYEAFIKNYTIKQWHKDPQELPASIINRLPVRFNYNETYFNNARFQGIPLDGYTAMFKRMIDHPLIELSLQTDYFECKDQFQITEKTIYTGPIDRYFDYQYGPLEWRSISLEKKVVDVPDFQGTSVMNYSDLNVDYTRIHEPSHLHPERKYAGLNLLFFMNVHQKVPMSHFIPCVVKKI